MTTTEEDEPLTEADLIMLIRDEHAKFVEAQRTISMLVEKVYL